MTTITKKEAALSATPAGNLSPASHTPHVAGDSALLGQPHSEGIVAHGDSPTFSLDCGVPTIVQTVIANLERRGFRHDPQASLSLIIDSPLGYALSALERAEVVVAQMIIVSWNPCVEYWEDLWELQPAALLVERDLDLDLAIAIQQARGGTRQRSTPAVVSPLTPTERRMLRYVARGWTNKNIASQLNVQCQTVLNALTNIYQKLGVHNRNEAALYYWGIWHVLERRTCVHALHRVSGGSSYLEVAQKLDMPQKLAS